ncbi:MAG: 5'-nucleotidase C-terminal domain-containing protein [Candidatus Aminicenantes bacterium]|nr:5'-nucleotidase C-terminal domain-containing protein [Candidatus Aminicenantes bacterium]
MKARKDLFHSLCRISAALFVLALIFCCCSLQGSKKSLILTILHTNDQHGHTLSYTHEGKDIGGLAERITLIKRLKEKAISAKGICLLFDAGDVTSGTLFSDSFFAEPDWKIYSKYYDAITLGNHDFDFPFDTTFNLIRKFRAPVISSNIYGRQTGQLIFPPYNIFQKENWKIAVIGVSHPDTPLISTLGNDERLEFRSVEEAVGLYVEELRKTNDLIIVLSHLGEDDKLAKAVRGIDLIVGGHSHARFETPIKENNTLLVNAGYGGQYIGQLSLLLTREKNEVTVRQIDYELLPVTGDLPPDKKILSLLQPYKRKFGDRGQAIIGETGEIFSRTPLAGSMSSSMLANLVADSYRYVTNADFAFVNEGGLRADLDKGPVTIDELHQVQPFNNTLIVFSLTGAQIIEIIRNMASFTRESGILFPSNLQITLRKNGEPIILTGDGEALVADKTYSVAVGSFIARGGDGHTSFPGFTQKSDTQIRTSDALKRYFEARGTVFPDETARLKNEIQ